MTEDQWRSKADDRLRSIEDRLVLIERDDAVATVHRDNVEKRLMSIEDTMKWLVRLIVGALILAVIAYFIRNGGAF